MYVYPWWHESLHDYLHSPTPPAWPDTGTDTEQAKQVCRRKDGTPAVFATLHIDHNKYLLQKHHCL